ncbi:hypothetical protein HY374_02330 [Candidatus Berkelbacteria bacterium]|nr:hypothetical protein [Candidatus Berkelbacteria bacterium]
MRRRYDSLKRLISQLLIGTLVLPVSLLQGAPGAQAAEPGPMLVLNEISPRGDWAELINPSTAPATLTGWELTSASGSQLSLDGQTVPAGGFITKSLALTDAGDSVYLKVAGTVADMASWGASVSAQLPTPTDLAQSISRTVDGAGQWVSNTDPTPASANMIDPDDVPGRVTALSLPVSDDNAAGMISAQTADNVTVAFAVTGEADHLAAKIADSAGLWTALEDDLAGNALDVDGIDATALADGTVTLHGYARNNGLLSAWATGSATKQTNVVTSEEAPAAPTNVVVLLDNTNRAVLSWTDSATLGIDAYRIYSNAGSGDVQLASPIATLDDDAVSYTTGVLNPGTWKFLVRAVKNSVESTNTTPATITIPVPAGATDTTAPAKPSNLLAKAEDGQVKLTWNTVADAVGYHVRYREATNTDTSAYTTLFVSGQSMSETTVKSLTNGILYEFGVAADDAAGNRSEHAVVEQTPTAASAGTNFVLPSQSTQPGAVTPTTKPKVTTASAPVTTAAVAPTTIAPAPIGGQVEETPAPEPTSDDTIRGETDDAAQADSTRTLVTILIIVIAAAAGFGGYYGYQWWVSRPEEVTTSTPPSAEPKKPKRPERGGRW